MTVPPGGHVAARFLAEADRLAREVVAADDPYLAGMAMHGFGMGW